MDGSYQFGDTRVASTLLKVHMVLCSAQYSTVASNAAPEVRVHISVISSLKAGEGGGVSQIGGIDHISSPQILVLIVDILVMYTKPKDVILEGEDRPGMIL